MFRGRRASTPSLSFCFADSSGFNADITDVAMMKRKSWVDGSGFTADLPDAATMRRKSLIDGSGSMADLKEVAALRRKSLVDYGTPLQIPLLRLHSPKAKAMSIDLANESPKTIEIVQQANQRQELVAVSQAIVVEDEQTALVHCSQARWHAKKALISAMRGGASDLAEAVAYARSQGVDNNILIKAEATFKQRKAAEVRSQCKQKCCSTMASTFAEAPDPAKLKAASISPEGQAALDGMMEAQTIISGDFKASAVFHKSPHPSMQRRRRSSFSVTDIRVR